MIKKFQIYLKNFNKISIFLILFYFLMIERLMSENKIEILDKNNNNIKIKLLRGFSNIYGVETNENFIFIPEFLTGNIYIIDKKKYKISKYFILDDKLIDKKPLLKLRSENLKKIHDVYIDKKKIFSLLQLKVLFIFLTKI